MTVICKIHKCVFCITIMIIFYAVILHLIAHPGTFLHRSHQYPTEPDAELQKNILWPWTYTKVTLLSCGVWQVNFCNYTFSNNKWNCRSLLFHIIKKKGKIFSIVQYPRLIFYYSWHVKVTFQTAFSRYNLMEKVLPQLKYVNILIVEA